MGFHRKASGGNKLDSGGGTYVTVKSSVNMWSGDQTIDISENKENLFKVYVSGKESSFCTTVKRGESKTVTWKPGTNTIKITITVSDSSILLNLNYSDTSNKLVIEGYRAIYYDYPNEEMTETAALYTLDTAAEMITQEVKASE